MNNNDFRYMRRGKPVSDLSKAQTSLLDSIDQRGTGKTRALLMLHGFSSTPAVYRLLIPRLKQYDAIVCPILSGHGDSIDAFSRSTASQWLDTATKACEGLIKEYQHVDVLGLSLGGLLACELSKRFPLNHLYLLAPALKLRLHLSAMITLAKALQYLGFKHLRNAAGNLINTEEAEIAYKKLPITTILEILYLVKDYQWVAPTCPVDLFLGRYDEVVASEQLEALVASLPNINVHWLKNSAHVLPLDKDLDEIVRCINATL